MNAGLTAEQFERAYAGRAGMSVEQLRSLGRVVRPCSCGDDLCEGWQSISAEHAAPDIRPVCESDV